MKFCLKWLLVLVGVILISIISLNIVIYQQPYSTSLATANSPDTSDFLPHSGSSRGSIDNDELTAKHSNLGVLLQDFCNLPFRALSGSEGNVSKRAYRLEAVLVVTRHGHRAPIFSPRDVDAKKRSKVQCDLNSNAVKQIGYPPLERFAQFIQTEVRDTLKRVRALSEHQRAPGSPSPKEDDLLASVYNDAYYVNTWNFFNLRGSDCASGQLSLFGLVQLLEMGRFFRRVYIDRWNLLPASLPISSSTSSQGNSHSSTKKIVNSTGTSQGKATLPPAASTNETYYNAMMKTTSSQRTHLSGIALMHAFLNLDNYPVNTARSQLDINDAEAYTRMQLPYFIKRVNFMNFCDEPSQRWLPPGSSCMCPALSPLAKALYQRSSRLQTDNQDVRNARFALFDFAPLHERTSGRLWLLDLVDLFVPDACFALQLPCANVSSSKPQQTEDIRCMNAAQLEALLGAVEMVGRDLNALAMQRHYSSVFIYPLLSEIVIRLRSIISTGNSAKLPDNVQLDEVTRFTHYSGHDFTVSDLLRALGLHRGGWPNYAARVVFELYSIVPSVSASASNSFDGQSIRANSSSSNSNGSASGSVRHVVRVLVNGVDMTRDLDACSGNTNADGLCTFEAFERFILTEMLAKHAQVKSFTEACRVQKPGPMI